MMEFVETVMNPQLAATVLAAVCVFATVLTIAMPMLARDRMNQRMKEMAIERDRMRTARLAEMSLRNVRAQSCVRHPRAS